ncbi:MAG: hypothetical protein KY457_12490, partial [Actinobacteria bacterium]|nr:hypothetical protein [Actinomycetota bacterium]
AVTIGWWTIDVADAPALAPFYEELLGWTRLFDDPDEGIALVPPGDLVWGRGLLLYMEHATGPKRTKNPAHLDLRPADQAAEVARALSLGATRVDVGQGEVAWEVLADPEGHEFCILAADGSVTDGLAVDSWALDVTDLERATAFWSRLLGWDVTVHDGGAYTELTDPSGGAYALDLLVTTDARDTKNRVHPDLLPSGEEDDDEARPREVERALSLGATRVDIGQGDTSWDVLADPEGNEFCILRPRGWSPTA